MDISLNLENDMDDVLLQKNSPVSQIIGSYPISAERISDGRNSRVYLITCKNLRKYVIKFYFSHELDKKDRMNVEFSSLQFLWNKGIRCIPKPIAVEKKHSFAVYSFIDGIKIPSEKVTIKDIEYITRFLKKLNELKLKEDSNKLPPASEACFSIKEMAESIENRYKRLLTLPKENKENYALHKFLEKEFDPQFSRIVKWCRLNLTENGIDYSSRISKNNQTLSPSDFGFHNALRRMNGQIVFLDFEYFGWDDPAKMISDFLLHPNMNLKVNHKRQFVRNMLTLFPEDQSLKIRLNAAFPLCGLKWTLIFLNEFLPEHFLRRNFAQYNKLIKNDAQAQQLLKAQHLLNKITKNFKNFPYKM